MVRPPGTGKKDVAIQIIPNIYDNSSEYFHQYFHHSVCNSIWSHLSTTSTNFAIHVQWIPSHIGLAGNTLADSEAKWGSTLSQSSVPIDLALAKAQIRRTGHQEFHTHYLADPQSATHRTLTGEVNPQFH